MERFVRGLFYHIFFRKESHEQVRFRIFKGV